MNTEAPKSNKEIDVKIMDREALRGAIIYEINQMKKTQKETALKFNVNIKTERRRKDLIYYSSREEI